MRLSQHEAPRVQMKNNLEVNKVLLMSAATENNVNIGVAKVRQMGL
jgi:hypothetical protein